MTTRMSYSFSFCSYYSATFSSSCCLSADGAFLVGSVLRPIMVNSNLETCYQSDQNETFYWTKSYRYAETSISGNPGYIGRS